MTPEEIQKAIATHLGYPKKVKRWLVECGFSVGSTAMLGFKTKDDAEAWMEKENSRQPGYADKPRAYDHEVKAPDFLNDLNAMHEAEKVLTNEQLKLYRTNLRLVAYNQGIEMWAYFHANAAQRAEAFVATIKAIP